MALLEKILLPQIERQIIEKVRISQFAAGHQQPLVTNYLFTDPAIVLSMFMLSFTDRAIILSMFMLSFTDPAIVLSMFMLSFTDRAINSRVSE
jgi:hypothetical protein